MKEERAGHRFTLTPLAQMIRGPAALPRGPGLCQKAVCTRNHNPKGG